MSIDASILRSNAVAMEAFMAMARDQKVSDRATYVDIVTEAFADGGNKATLVQKLYSDIINHSKIDFGKIPKSMGDITKYYYYPQMSDSMEILNRLTANLPDQTPIKVMNRAHDIIITERANFDMGFKFGNDFLKLTYNLLVLGLYEQINVCICKYTDYLRDVLETDSPASHVNYRKAKNYAITNYLAMFIRSYDNGDWKKIVAQFRTNPSNFLGPIGDGVSFIVGQIGPVGTAIAATVAVLVSIRYLTYLFYSSTRKFKEWAVMQVELVRNYRKIEGEKDETVIQKQEKWLNRLEGIAHTSHTKLAKAEALAEDKISTSNRNEFSTDKIVRSDLDISDISIV